MRYTQETHQILIMQRQHHQTRSNNIVFVSMFFFWSIQGFGLPVTIFLPSHVKLCSSRDFITLWTVRRNQRNWRTGGSLCQLIFFPCHVFLNCSASSIHRAHKIWPRNRWKGTNDLKDPKCEHQRLYICLGKTRILDTSGSFTPTKHSIAHCDHYLPEIAFKAPTSIYV